MTDLERRLDEAKCELEELTECGDLEEILEAAFRVEELERRLATSTTNEE